jgi:hypothetical protein
MEKRRAPPVWITVCSSSLGGPSCSYRKARGGDEDIDKGSYMDGSFFFSLFWSNKPSISKTKPNQTKTKQGTVTSTTVKDRMRREIVGRGLGYSWLWYSTCQYPASQTNGYSTVAKLCLYDEQLRTQNPEGLSDVNDSRYQSLPPWCFSTFADIYNSWCPLQCLSCRAKHISAVDSTWGLLICKRISPGEKRTKRSDTVVYDISCCVTE